MNSTIKTIKSNEVKSIINMLPKSAIMTVEFVKKNGKTRILNGRRGVKSYLNQDATRKHPVQSSKIVTLFEMSSKQYRSVIAESVTRISANKVTFIVSK